MGGDALPRLRWSPAAYRDLSGISAYIAAESEGAASRVAHALCDAADSLRFFPRRGRRVPELDRDDVREIFVYRYRLIYRVSADATTLLRIVHGARRLPPL